MKYRVIRYSEQQPNGEVIADDLTDKTFLDTTADPEGAYEYKVEAYTDRDVYQDRDSGFMDNKSAGIQYPPDLDGVDDNVILSAYPLVWDDLPTVDADNGSLRLLEENPFGFVYAFDALWEARLEQYISTVYMPGPMAFIKDIFQIRGNQISSRGEGAFTWATFTSIGAEVISNLDVSNVTGMYMMFFAASCNTQMDLSGWNVSNVTGTSDQVDIGGGNLTSRGGMDYMFHTFPMYGRALGGPLRPGDLSDWCVSQFTKVPAVFFFGDGAFEDYLFGGLSSQDFLPDSHRPNWGAAC